MQVLSQSLALVLPGSDQIGSRLDQLVGQLGGLYGDREQISEQSNDALVCLRAASAPRVRGLIRSSPTSVVPRRSGATYGSLESSPILASTVPFTRIAAAGTRRVSQSAARAPSRPVLPAGMLSEAAADIGHRPCRILPRAVEQPVDAALQPDPQGIEDHREEQHDDRGLHRQSGCRRARDQAE